MNKNKIITDDFSSEESKHLYETEYAENEASRIAYKQGYQCGDCSFFAPFNKDYGLCCFKPRLCSRRRSEEKKTSVRREVGAILCRRHIHTYVEKQNREIPTSRDSKDFQAAVDVYCTIWVKESKHFIETVFEHFTCSNYVNEGWGVHSFTTPEEFHCKCQGESKEEYEKLIKILEKKDKENC